MVGAAAASDAIARARRLPKLRVGLHLVLLEGTPVSPSADVADLVDRNGQFRRDIARLGAEIFFRPSVRRQVRAEIEAQFRAFRETGLPLDHVNAHKHFHLHPSIAADILAIGADYGMRALRVPDEPRTVLAKVERSAFAPVAAVVGPWARLLKRRVRRAKVRSPDAVFGLAWSGAMTPRRVAGILDHLPDGATEIYFHPATRAGFAGSARGYRYGEELQALLAPMNVAAARRPDIALCGYADIRQTS